MLNSLWVPLRSAFVWWYKIGESAVLGGHPALARLLLNLDKVHAACCLSFLFSVSPSQIFCAYLSERHCNQGDPKP